MPSGWTIAFWIAWLAPIPVASAWGLTRLAPDHARWPPWPVLTAAVLALAPAAGALLLIIAQLIDVAAPLGGTTTILTVLLADAIYVGAVWAITTPRGRRFSVGVLGAATLVTLLGLLTGPSLTGFSNAGLLLAALIGLPMLVLAAVAPAAVDRWWRTGEDKVRWLAPAALGVLLIVLSLAAGGFAIVEATAGNTTTPATYRWSVEISPEDDAAYTVAVPFPTATDQAQHPAVLAGFREQVEVEEGEAEIFWAAPGWVQIRGEGPVTVAASHAFWADIGAREAFGDWTITNATVTRGPEGEGNLTIDWRVDFSGGGGHTCWANGHAVATLAPGQTGTLEVPDEAPAEGRFWAGYCA